MLEAPPILLPEGLRTPELSDEVEGLRANPFGDIAIFGDIASPLNDGGKDTGTPIAEQALTGGVVTPQIVGSLRALLTLILIPKESAVLLPNSLHKQIGLPSINPANSGQHPLSGFVNLLPSSTNVKQSDIFVRAIKHPSSAGDGAKTAVSGAGD